MRRALLVAVLAATLAHADETPDESEMVIVPRVVLKSLLIQYQTEKLRNDKLQQRQDNYQSGTGCT